MKCAKTVLRQSLKERRSTYVKSLVKQQIDQINIDVAKNLQIYLKSIAEQFPQQKIILAGFYPINFEVDCLQVIKFLQASYQCSLPVHFKNEEQKPLFFREYHSDTQLIKGEYNIPIPSESSPVVIPNIILTPFLGFDKDTLQRIGYGGGHFDRTIKQYKDNKIAHKFIGIGYDFQYVNDLPIEEQDQPLDCIITEKGIYTK